MNDFRDAAEQRERVEGVDDAPDLQHVSEQAHADAEFARGRAELLRHLVPDEPCVEQPPLAGHIRPAENGARIASASGCSTEGSDALERRRSAQGYFDAGLPWTGEFEDLVNEGLVDVS